MIGNTFQFAWEVSLIEWCQSYIPSFLIKALDIISNLGDEMIVVALLGFFYLCYDKKLGRKIAVNAILSLLFAGEIKNIFKRRRPYFDNKNIECMKAVDKNYDIYDLKKQGYSMPSMHSSNISNISMTFYEYYRKHSVLVIAIVISGIVGISRFVLGCHYPTDVLTGWTIGVLSAIFLSKLQDKISDTQLYIIMIIVMIIGLTYCESSDFFSTCGIAIGFIGSDILDRKYINHKDTRNIIKIIARLFIAFALFLAISEGLKYSLPVTITEAETLFAHLFRTFRYALGLFVAAGLSPILYKYNILKLDDNMKDDK